MKDLEYKKMSGKSIFVPYYNKNSIVSNKTGFFNILEVTKIYKIKHLIFASTSSVYGDSKKFPLNETDKTDSPLSFYAATKKSNEIIFNNDEKNKSHKWKIKILHF